MLLNRVWCCRKHIIFYNEWRFLMNDVIQMDPEYKKLIQQLDEFVQQPVAQLSWGHIIVLIQAAEREVAINL